MKEIKDFIYYNKTYIIIGFILLFLVLALFIGKKFNSNNNNNNNITKNDNIIEKKLVLFGSNEITLNYNEKYQEPGYYAINEEGNLKTNDVLISGNVNEKIADTYTITYKYGDIIKTRTIIVLEKKQEENNNNETPKDNEENNHKPENNQNNNEETIKLELLTITLKGEQTIVLNTNEKYQEPGFIAKYNNIDLTNNVTTSSNYIENKPGNYTITYTINYKNLKKQVIRGIVVLDSNLNLSLKSSNTNYTNSSVDITIVVSGNNFYYLKYPNKDITQKQTSTYTISSNGSYTFTAYNKEKKEFTKTIKISNIDKKSPTGSCEATINNDNTVIKVNANDNLSGIKSYTYKSSGYVLGTSTKNKFTYNKKTSKTITVQVEDNAKNYTFMTCKVIDKSYYPVIKPVSSENVVAKAETDSLKAYISKFSDYYLTRIWVYDAYKQLSKYDSPEYGKNLYKPSVLLDKATNEYNLKDKLLIGFNASGFYLKDVYDAANVNKYPPYDKTSVGTIVITNGKVIRNVYDKGDLTTWFITGVTPTNKMVVFEDKRMKNTSVDEKKAWSEQVINSKIRNTYTFAAPVILDGKRTNYTNQNSRMPGSNSSKKGLQMLCQINENNFVLFTTKNSTRNVAISKFLELGCQTAVNLDGGGSVALIYKPKGSTEIKTIIGNGRSLPEVGYFREA